MDRQMDGQHHAIIGPFFQNWHLKSQTSQDWGLTLKLRNTDAAGTFHATIGRKFALHINLRDDDIDKDSMTTTNKYRSDWHSQWDIWEGMA